MQRKGVTKVVIGIVVFMVFCSGCAAVEHAVEPAVEPAIYTTDKFLVDSQSSLMWIRKLRSSTTDTSGRYVAVPDSLELTGSHTYAEAAKIISDLNKIKYGGFEDWRLPSSSELHRLLLIGEDQVLLLAQEAKAKGRIVRPTVLGGLGSVGYYAPSACWTSEAGKGNEVKIVPLQIGIKEINDALSTRWTRNVESRCGVCPVRTATEK